jgi:hypothetical protein
MQMRRGAPDSPRRSGAGALLGPFGSGEHPIQIDWPRWLGLIERKRRALSRLNGRRHLSGDYYFQETLSSFRLDGMETTSQQVADALRPGSAGKTVRSRITQRIRNHAAILRAIDRWVRAGKSLTTQMVIRWYTSISNGLSTTSLDERTADRLDSVVRRVNSPQLRLQAALIEVARLHSQLLADPFFPSFHGILSRLLLQFHLGRCGLPPIVFDADLDPPALANENRLLVRILDRLDGSFDRILMGDNGR